MSQKILLTNEFAENSKIYLDTALYIAVSKNRDGFAIYDGEAIKCLSGFLFDLEEEVEGKYNENHLIYEFLKQFTNSLLRTIDSKVDRRFYSKTLQDNLSDYFEEILTVFLNGFKKGYLLSIPLLDENDVVKYYCYNSEKDDYVYSHRKKEAKIDD